MGIRRMDHVGVVVRDLAAVRDLFLAIGLEEAGGGTVGGAWVDRIVGLEGVRSELVALRIPGSETWLELARFASPPGPGVRQDCPDAPGLRHLCFAVDDLDATLAAVRALGYDTIGTVERYEDRYLLCYVRGPEGLIIELAQDL